MTGFKISSTVTASPQVPTRFAYNDEMMLQRYETFLEEFPLPHNLGFESDSTTDSSMISTDDDIEEWNEISKRIISTDDSSTDTEHQHQIQADEKEKNPYFECDHCAALFTRKNHVQLHLRVEHFSK